MVACNKQEVPSHDQQEAHSTKSKEIHQHSPHEESALSDDHEHAEESEDEHGALGAHVHGEVHLAMAVDGLTIALELTAPAESLIGFENTPKSEEELKIWQNFKEQWDNPSSTYFEFDHSIECVKQSSKATFEAEGEHSEVRAEMTYACKKSATNGHVIVHLAQVFPRIHLIEAEVLPDERASYVKKFKLGKSSNAAFKLEL